MTEQPREYAADRQATSGEPMTRERLAEIRRNFPGADHAVGELLAEVDRLMALLEVADRLAGEADIAVSYVTIPEVAGDLDAAVTAYRALRPAQPAGSEAT